MKDYTPRNRFVWFDLLEWRGAADSFLAFNSRTQFFKFRTA